MMLPRPFPTASPHTLRRIYVASAALGVLGVALGLVTAHRLWGSGPILATLWGALLATVVVGVARWRLDQRDLQQARLDLSSAESRAEQWEATATSRKAEVADLERRCTDWNARCVALEDRLADARVEGSAYAALEGEYATLEAERDQLAEETARLYAEKLVGKKQRAARRAKVQAKVQAKREAKATSLERIAADPQAAVFTASEARDTSEVPAIEPEGYEPIEARLFPDGAPHLAPSPAPENLAVGIPLADITDDELEEIVPTMMGGPGADAKACMNTAVRQTGETPLFDLTALNEGDSDRTNALLAEQEEEAR